MEKRRCVYCSHFEAFQTYLNNRALTVWVCGFCQNVQPNQLGDDPIADAVRKVNDYANGG